MDSRALRSAATRGRHAETLSCESKLVRQYDQASYSTARALVQAQAQAVLE